MWDEKVCLEKLTAAKQILEDTITGTNCRNATSKSVPWKSEWITPIRRWSSAISVRTDNTTIVLRFPCSPTKSDKSNKLEAAIPIYSNTNLSVELETSMEHYFYDGDIFTSSPHLDDRMLMHYREQADLELVPSNLLVWCILFFVKQLGGRTKHSHNQATRYDNWLFILPQHRFPEFDTMPLVITSRYNHYCGQGWVSIQMMEYATTLELPSSYYLRHLLTSFATHLIARTIQNCFSWRGKIVLNDACRFAAALTEEPCRNILLNYTEEGCDQFVRVAILERLSYDASLKDKLAFKVPAFSLSNPLSGSSSSLDSLKERKIDLWDEALEEEGVVKLIGNLDYADIDCILRISIEINHHIDELKESVSFHLEFPTANDHFQTFDLPHLRGTLAQTTPVLRLTAYAENAATLREQTTHSTSPIPAGVVDLMGSYLPPF